MCGNSERRVQSGKKKTNCVVPFLLSCCLFLLVVSGCLLTALIYIGKHVIDNVPSRIFNHRQLFLLPTEENFKRLPNDTKPIRYDLTLLPNFDMEKFQGSVNITVNVTGFRNNIILHSKNLTIVSVDLSRANSKVLSVMNVKENLADEVVIITPREKVTPGLYFLFIKFESTLTGKLRGFYLSKYRRNGESRTIATSKFEPTYARQAFPCFDEPNMKAKYVVHLQKPKLDNYIALSNYPVKEIVDHGDDHQIVTFEETVSMSTYLTCFIVSDFTHTTTTFNNNGVEIPLKVYASPENLDKTTYAGGVGKKVIEYYINYFNISYPLPKLDMVAIPDFVSGAMEHWGLVTYRETALLYTNKTHSSANKQRVATVVAHELAHSWFGNLVTMDWWNDLWLNEGFASYIEYKGVNAAESDWQMMTQFLTSELHPVMSLDATLSSHAIVQTVTTPDEITAIFDTITYNKGASILRMLENAVGEENFQKGVTNYLNKYVYSNAVTKNFLDEIQNVVGNSFDIAEVMSTFTAQTGYPILNLESVNGNTYTFTQQRFLKDPEATYNSSEATYGYKWSIPVTYITDQGKSEDFTMFNYKNNEVTINIPDGAKWVKFNYDQVGYYRVNYTIDLWNNLISYYNSMDVADRTHLLEESFSIAEAGLVPYQIPLEFTKQLTDELDYTTWQVASTKLTSVVRYLNGSSQQSALKNYISNIVSNAYNNLSWTESDDDSHVTRLARVTVLGLACSAGHKECLAEAQSRFNSWINDTTEELSQDLRTLVYNYGTKNADQTTWEKLLEVYLAENDANEKLKLINGLAQVENTTLLSRLLDLAQNESIVRSQDYFTVLQYISGNSYGTSLVWDYVRENWEGLVARFTLNDRYLGSLIPAITNKFVTEERLQEMKDFFAKYPDAGAGTANRATALENVSNNIRWLARYKTSVEEWIIKLSEN